MLVECAKCGEQQAFVRGGDNPRGAVGRAEHAGWVRKMTIGGEVWLCPACEKKKGRPPCE